MKYTTTKQDHVTYIYGSKDWLALHHWEGGGSNCPYEFGEAGETTNVLDVMLPLEQREA